MFPEEAHSGRVKGKCKVIIRISRRVVKKQGQKEERCIKNVSIKSVLSLIELQNRKWIFTLRVDFELDFVKI